MDEILIQTGSRLHFGLLALEAEAPRKFGGVGLMVEEPGLRLRARASGEWGAEGVLAARALGFARRVVEGLSERGFRVPPTFLKIEKCPPEHVGLGTGTQLGLVVARVLAARAGLEGPSLELLAGVSGRGLRSGIGLHGFERGGLLVDGGRGASGGLPPLLCRVELPEDWWVLVVLPRLEPGLHGSDELRAFAELPSSSEAETDRLCRLVLLGVLPAAVEGDLEAFGEALEELQRRVGEAFAPVQGGMFAHKELNEMIGLMREWGLKGVGQSSWGPALYGFAREDAEWREEVAERLREGWGLDSERVFWTRPTRQGAMMWEDAHTGS